MLFRNQVRNQRRGRRARECPGCAQEEQHRIDGIHVTHALTRQQQQRRGAHSLHCITAKNNLASIEAVCNMSGWKQKDQSWNKLHQSRVAKVNCAMRNGIHLPRHRYGLGGVSEHSCNARQLEPPEVARGKSLHAASGRLSGKCMHGLAPRLYRWNAEEEEARPSSVYPKGLTPYSQLEHPTPSSLAAAAVTLCGVCAFLGLYCTQPMLPMLEGLFHASKTAVGMT